MKNIDQVGAKRTHGGGNPQKYILNERGRHLMLLLYDGTSARIDELQRRLGVPRYLVRRWATQMRLTHSRGGSRWRKEDIAYLEKHINTKTLAEIAEHLCRTEESVRTKAYLLGLLERDAYTLKDVYDGLGSSFTTATKWIDRGWLKGTRRDETSNWYFSDKQIKDFLRAHPYEIDIRRVDQLWFLDLCLGGLGPLSDLH
jgi:hypothetical protein